MEKTPKANNEHVSWKNEDMEEELLSDHGKTDSDDDDFNNVDYVDTPKLDDEETHPLLDDFEELDDYQSDLDEDAPNTDEL
ncbi:MAG: hypothetical protein ABIP95_02230 [Pelobium sp.]